MKLNNIDFNKIAIFCQIIESGNYQRASEVLHVTPSALSQTITSLEHSLGLSLFDRRGKKLLPTQIGQRLHQEFRTRQLGFLQALREMEGQQQEVSGMLRIGAYLEFAKSRLSAPLRDFIREFPDANVKMTFDSPSRLHGLLDQGHLDLCFSIFPSSEKKTVRSTALTQEELVLISPPHLLRESPTLEQVTAVPIIDYYFNHQLIRRWVSVHYGKRPKVIPVRIFAAAAEMVVALVKQGAGIGVVPRYLVSSEEVQKDVSIIRPTSKRIEDYIWLLERTSSEKTPTHAMFRKNVLKYFEND
jgi:DNA-binding transcriptional LysR family regulator